MVKDYVHELKEIGPNPRWSVGVFTEIPSTQLIEEEKQENHRKLQ